MLSCAVVAVPASVVEASVVGVDKKVEPRGRARFGRRLGGPW